MVPEPEKVFMVALRQGQAALEKKSNDAVNFAPGHGGSGAEASEEGISAAGSGGWL